MVSEPGMFNMALQTLIRIDHLLQQSNESCIHKSFLQWASTLRAMSLELDPFLDLEDQEELRKKMQNITTVSLNPQAKMNNLELSNCLYNTDIYIRRKLYDCGLLMAKAKDPKLALQRNY